MQLILPPQPIYQVSPCVYVEHKGHQLEWTTQPFARNNFDDDRGLFLHINGYWASLPEREQNAIFTLYIRMMDIFDSVIMDNGIDQQLSECLQELFEYHPFEKVRHWATVYSNIIFPGPPHLPLKYSDTPEERDDRYTREKSYIVPEYVDLVCLVIQMRIMIPIWGKYIARTNKIAGTIFKEFYAFKLLDHTRFVKEPPIQRLYTYIKETLPAKGSLIDMLRGISNDEFPLWTMAQLIVRKLSLSDIRGVDPTPILVRHIFTHISEKANRAKDEEAMGIKNKNNIKEGTGVSEEEQRSILEHYKMKGEISTGDIQYLLWGVEDPYEVAKIIYPGVIKELTRKMLTQADALISAPADPAQTQLLRWLIDVVVPGEAVSFMTREMRAKCLCAAAAAYWAKGFHLVASLCTATPVPKDEGVVLTGTESKGRLTKETIEKLEVLFPYNRRTRAGKVIQEELLAIDNLIRLFGKQTWLLNLPPDQMAVIHPQFPTLRRLTLPHNFKEELAKLIIDLASRPRDYIKETRSI